MIGCPALHKCVSKNRNNDSVPLLLISTPPPFPLSVPGLFSLSGPPIGPLGRASGNHSLSSPTLSFHALRRARGYLSSFWPPFSVFSRGLSSRHSGPGLCIFASPTRRSLTCLRSIVVVGFCFARPGCDARLELQWPFSEPDWQT